MTRYNTTPNWQDPYNPPSPGDPYWDEWLAANPDGPDPLVARGDPKGNPVSTHGASFDAPPPPTPGPTTTGGGGGGVGTTTGSSPFPTFTPPGFSPQVPYTYTPFTYHDFAAPTLEDARNQPGYQFGLQQGQDAIQNSAAARGTLRGGGTLKDLFGYTNAAAEQNYGNVFNQQKTIYDENRDNAFGTWAANNQQAQFANTSLNAGNQLNYQDAYQNAAGAFNPLFQASTLTFNDAYNRWLAKLNALSGIAGQGAA